MANTKNDIVLSLVKAGKTYAGVPAIKEIDFDLYRGEIHALVGENGAGKSTLCKAIVGAIVLTSGKIMVEEKVRLFQVPKDALKLGLAMVYQETSLVPTMTVAQNIQLGKEKFHTSLKKLNINMQQLIQSLHFEVDPKMLVSSLGSAQKQMVEITRAVYYDAKVIIFDEPTASLTPEEKQHLFNLISSLKKKGVSIIFISHALEEALEIADRITVLRDGQHVITANTNELSKDLLVKHMVGRELQQGYKLRTKNQTVNRRKILSVENVIKGKMVKNMSFSVYAGEITAIAGLVGSGRTEIAHIIAGVEQRNFVRGGDIYLEGNPVHYYVPKQAINDGIVYVTEDRKLNGFFETMGIEDNIHVGWLSTRLGRRFFLSQKERKGIGENWKDRLKIKGLNRNDKVNKLSGGNQQKVVVAKSLIQKPKLVIFDEPTRGVDVGAIEEIHRIIRSLADEDIGVLVISSYLPEILKISDRILVARQGRIVEEFSPEDATEEKIMFAAIH
ncbi:MAG: sugar ABC transporter ATP-binding protein [Deltaproteobacteria bacterium]|nr:sugar ABC transporter ATP-binding protein [Deltaproteobacteria bacterium]MBT4644487.1 sugar ABC transporter ATP-binding protein [Deltaproteobacteria bacterium]